MVAPCWSRARVSVACWRPSPAGPWPPRAPASVSSTRPSRSGRKPAEYPPRRSGDLTSRLPGRRGTLLVPGGRRHGPHPFAQPVLLVGEGRDVGLGVGELRATRTARRTGRPRCRSRSTCTARSRSRSGRARCVPAAARAPPGRGRDPGRRLCPGHGLLVRVDVDAPVRALPRAQHAHRAVLLQQRDHAPAAGGQAIGSAYRRSCRPPSVGHVAAPGGGRGTGGAAAPARAAQPGRRSPGSFAPGHVLRRPGGQHEVLAQRVPLEPVGQQQRRQVAGAPSKTTPNISCVSRSCHAAPR